MKTVAIVLAVIVVAVVSFDFLREPEIRRHEYPVLNLEILRNIPDQDLDYAIVDHVSYLIGGEYQKEYKIVMALPREIRAIYTTWGVDAEVHNGGFNQYFWNSAGQFWREAIEGYELIGANEHADLLREAAATYEGEEKKLQKHREKGTLEAFSESYEDNPLNQLDNRFFKLTDASALRVSFIRKNLDAFQSKKN